MMGLMSTSIIHHTNHTQTTRVCDLFTQHQLTYLEYDLHEYTNLLPGLYYVIISNKEYFFDIYTQICGDDKLYIINANNAYIIKSGKKHTVILYKLNSIIEDNKTEFDNTINATLDMIVITGLSKKKISKKNNFKYMVAFEPKNGELPSYDDLLRYNQSLDELEPYNNIYRNLILDEEIRNIIAIEEKANQNPTYRYLLESTQTLDMIKNNANIYNALTYQDIKVINKDKKYNDIFLLNSTGMRIDMTNAELSIPPKASFDISSISNFSINSQSKLDSENFDILDVLLKNNLKSLPNGVCDTCILNSEFQYMHFIYNVGRRILTGTEEWEMIEELSSDEYYLFYLYDDSIKNTDDENAIICTKFTPCSYSEIIQVDRSSISCGSDNPGVYIKIPVEYIDSQNPLYGFKQWLFKQIKLSSPVIIEYQYAEPKYITTQIDEYHLKTYYPSTYVKLNKEYNVSYFYKSLNVRG